MIVPLWICTRGELTRILWVVLYMALLTRRTLMFSVLHSPLFATMLFLVGGGARVQAATAKWSVCVGVKVRATIVRWSLHQCWWQPIMCLSKFMFAALGRLV